MRRDMTHRHRENLWSTEINTVIRFLNQMLQISLHQTLSIPTLFGDRDSQRIPIDLSPKKNAMNQNTRNLQFHLLNTYFHSDSFRCVYSSSILLSMRSASILILRDGDSELSLSSVSYIIAANIVELSTCSVRTMSPLTKFSI